VRRVAATLILEFVFIASAAVHGGGTPLLTETIRVLTYNIHHGEGTDGLLDLARIAAIIKSAQPDLVALQEVDERTDRTGRIDELGELERLTGMHGTFGKAMPFSGGDYGVAVLSRWPMLGVDNHSLPSSPDREPRTELTITTRPDEDGPVLRFTSTHFDQGRDELDRLAQAESVNERETRVAGPAILAGDMNAAADSEVMKTLEREWTDTASSAAPPSLDSLIPRPRFQRDYVLFRPANAWRVIESKALDDRIASDHRPVLAVIEWSGSH
jgi:endonuclease/exonuclease/phosphatase family metal-dependent hydrolase